MDRQPTPLTWTEPAARTVTATLFKILNDLIDLDLKLPVHAHWLADVGIPPIEREPTELDYQSFDFGVGSGYRRCAWVREGRETLELRYRYFSWRITEARLSTESKSLTIPIKRTGGLLDVPEGNILLWKADCPP